MCELVCTMKTSPKTDRTDVQPRLIIAICTPASPIKTIAKASKRVVYRFHCDWSPKFSLIAEVYYRMLSYIAKTNV